MELVELQERVKAGIISMGLSENEAQWDEHGQWVLLKDEIPVYIDAWEETESTPWNYANFEKDRSIFQITIPFCFGPTLKRDAFFEELLSVNLNLLFGKFSFNSKENISVISYRIPGEAFQSTSLQSMIDLLAYYSEMAYHVLKDEFNLKRVSAVN